MSETNLPLEIERKFLIALPDAALLNEKSSKRLDIEQVYLRPGAEIDLRNGETLHALFPEQRRVRQRDEKFPLDLEREAGFTHK